VRIKVPKQPTDRNRRYQLWYMSKPVIKVESNPFEITRIIAGPGEKFIIRGGPRLDWMLSQGIDDLVAEPIG
jgi:hypothetical protein